MPETRVVADVVEGVYVDLDGDTMNGEQIPEVKVCQEKRK